MKKLFVPVFCILLSVMLISVLPTEAEAAIYDDTIRLHILANSDSSADQKLKLEVRDEILKKYGSKLKSSEGFEEAENKILELLPEIEKFAETFIRESGYDYDLTCELCREWYDTRVYEDFTLPKGYYTSLKIKIGAAKGKNWWCVMFPPLCLDAALEDAPSDDGIIDYTKEELILIKNKKYNVKFKILELLSDAFS